MEGRLAHADDVSSLTKDESNSEPSTSTEAPEVSLGTTNRLLSVEQSGDIGPKKRRLYTDWIVFAPLSSSFSLPHEDVASPVTPTSNAHQTTVQGNTPATGNAHSVLATSRRQWIAQWMESNPGKLRPCSAKAVYRIADRASLERFDYSYYPTRDCEPGLNLVELKERASQFEVDFFLKNWATIRDSKAMRDVWHQIRIGHHPGFEEEPRIHSAKFMNTCYLPQLASV
ncbi:TRAF protein [Salix suchowensis]|nr:TRAF protein [Salix suchowensis]